MRSGCLPGAERSSVPAGAPCAPVAMRSPRQHGRTGHPPAQPLLLKTSFQLLLGSFPALQLFPWPACPPGAGGTRRNASARQRPRAAPARGPDCCRRWPSLPRHGRPASATPRITSADPLLAAAAAVQGAASQRKWPMAAPRPRLEQDACGQSRAAQPCLGSSVCRPPRRELGGGWRIKEKNSNLIGKASQEKKA